MQAFKNQSGVFQTKNVLIFFYYYFSLEVVIIRFILHAAMWIGHVGKQDFIINLISSKPADVGTFLMDHMKLDIKQLANILDKNEEYAQLLLHKTLMSMKLNHDPIKNNDWSSKKDVKEWETSFAKVGIRYYIIFYIFYL